MKEQRRHTRQQAGELLVACDSNTGAVIGEIANICESGVMLISKNAVSLNTTIRCVVALPDIMHGEDRLNFEARSKWCEPDEQSTVFRTGYEFQELTTRNLALIRNLLRHRPALRSMANIF